MSGLSSPTRWYASGNACATPWSVIAIDFIPHFIALLIKSVADVTASIWLILVCMCNSTLFTSALSCLTSFFTPVLSTIVFAITVSSPENESICAFPSIFTPFTLPILFIIFLAFPFSRKALHVSVLVPSYKSKLNNVFPDFNSLSSIKIISPSNETAPSSGPNSETFVSGAVIFIVFPKINGVSSSSSSFGSSGILFSISIIVFAITVTSPAYVSKPAFPITFIPFACSICAFISFPSLMPFANDLHVIVPVPSYSSIISIPLPDFVSLHSIVSTLPSSVTLPSFAVMSFILISFSFAFDGFPIMYFCSSITALSNSKSSLGIPPISSIGM